MYTITEAAAAAMLSVPPSTLREWEARFGYPKPLNPGEDRMYDQDEMHALHEALCSALSVSSAIARARGSSEQHEKAAQAGNGSSSAERFHVSERRESPR